MVKVIKKNNKTKCYECKSILKFEKEDIIEKKYSDGSHRISVIKCPICGYETPVCYK